MLAIVDIEIGYDCTNQYYLVSGIIPSNTIANIKLPTNLVTINGVVVKEEYVGASAYVGPEIVWASLCSHRYIYNLKSNYINPIFLLYYDNVAANIEYFNAKYRILKSFECNIYDAIIKFIVLGYTNIGSYYIPVKAEADIMHIIDNSDTNNIKYATDVVYNIFVENIVTNCSRTDFKPAINKLTRIIDARYKGIKDYPSQVYYYATNWLTDDELTNHPAFIEEYNRIKGIKMANEFMVKRIRYGKLIFFTIFILSLIPTLYIVYKYKIKQYKN
ncbi:MAG: hypothetical protein ACP5T0_13255 [Verrucomicrobiia bacterium]